MSDQMLRAAIEEKRALEAELAKNPTFLKLQAVNKIIELFSPGLFQVSEGKPASEPRPHVTRTGGPNRGTDTQAYRIRSGAASYLQNKGAAASSGEILAALERSGLRVVGKKPSAVVASYLSHSKEFVATSDGYCLAAKSPTDTSREPQPPSEPPREVASAPFNSGAGSSLF